MGIQTPLPPRHRCGIALGSNVGDRLQHLREAVRRLLQRVPDVRVLAAAPVYETDPVDCAPGTGAFYNTVIEIETATDPLPLLGQLLEIEESMGRSRQHDWHAPRTIDLDLLYADDLTLNQPQLTLPHPRIAQRRFVLEPLAKIRAELILPGQSIPILALLERLRSEEAPLRLIATDWQ